MDEAREGENKEDRQTKDKVCLEDPVYLSDVVGGAGLECENALCPGHELDHLRSVEMLRGQRNGRQPQSKLDGQEREYGRIAEARICTDARIEYAAVKKNERARDGEDTGDAACDDREDLLGAVTDAHCIEKLNGSQQTDKMAGEDHEDAEVEEHRPQYELFAPQEL